MSAPSTALQMPRELGAALADRMRGIPTRVFIVELDEILENMREEMLAAGRAAPAAFLICRKIRKAALAAWHAPQVADHAQ